MTRGRILDAAARLLRERGYAATTITAVAESAGVAVPTVYKAFGSKPELFKQAYDYALAGDDHEVPIGEREEVRAILELRDPREAVFAYARLVARTSARIGPLLSALSRAADSEPRLAVLASLIDEERRRGNAAFAAHLAELGVPDSAARIADLLWLFTAPDPHRRLVLERGWDLDAFSAWLGEVLTLQLAL
jgi:AcrR family transcriptional regulator